MRKLDADREAGETLREWPSVVAVVPARNEADTIGMIVAALVHQDYPGAFSVVVVDDHSEEMDTSIARQVAVENGAGTCEGCECLGAARRLDWKTVGAERGGVRR